MCVLHSSELFELKVLYECTYYYSGKGQRDVGMFGCKCVCVPVMLGLVWLGIQDIERWHCTTHADSVVRPCGGFASLSGHCVFAFKAKMSFS